MPNDKNMLEVNVQIHVRQANYGSGALSLTHTFSVRADSFTDIASILLQYDKLSKSIEAANAK